MYAALQGRIGGRMTTTRITLDESSSSTSGGTSATTIAQPLEHDFDPVALGDGPAHAIRDAVADGIRAITEMSKDGKHRLFNRTGHLVDGVEIGVDGDTYAIVAPEDRLEDDDVMQKLAELVAAITDPLGIPAVAAAIERADVLKGRV